MGASLEEPLVRAYLDELAFLLRNSPERSIIVAEVRSHIQQAAVSPERRSLSQILEQLGDPADVAAGATAKREQETPSRRPNRSIALLAVVSLAIGSFAMPAAGWLAIDFLPFAFTWAAAIVLLWYSNGWTAIEKLVATATAPIVFIAVGCAQKVASLDAGVVMQAAVIGLYLLLVASISAVLLTRFKAAA